MLLLMKMRRFIKMMMIIMMMMVMVMMMMMVMIMRESWDMGTLFHMIMLREFHVLCELR